MSGQDYDKVLTWCLAQNKSSVSSNGDHLISTEFWKPFRILSLEISQGMSDSGNRNKSLGMRRASKLSAGV
jgi:hypothetical protein